MSDRSDEVTESRDAGSTDDLLEETERLLEDSGADAGSAASSPSTESQSETRGRADSGSSPTAESETEPGLDDAAASDDGPWWRSSDETAGGAEAAGGTGSEREHGSGIRARLSRLTPSLSLGEYFSPKEFLAAALLLGIGVFLGGILVPVVTTAGQLLGLFAVAFLIGLLASKRRYLEVTAGGVTAGVVAAVAEYAFITFIGSASGWTLLAIGGGAGLLATLAGYYFGRDLRAGLARDVE